MEDTKILEKIEKLYKEASDYRKQFESSWKEEERFYYGKHWKFAEKRPVKNWIFSTIEAEIPLLLDARPASDVIPYDSEGRENAAVLSAAIQWTYDHQNLMIKLHEAVREFLRCGTAHHYVDYDPDLENGEGAITIKTIPWQQIYIDPTANLIDESNFVIINFQIRKEELIRRYPKFKEEIEDGSYASDEYLNGISEFLDPEKWDGIGGTNSGINTKSRFASEDIVTVRESWLKDYELENIPDNETSEEIAKEAELMMSAENPVINKWQDHVSHVQAHDMLIQEVIQQGQGNPDAELMLAIIKDHIEEHQLMINENPTSQRPKYPNAWRLVITVGELILYDGKPPVDDGMIPLVPYYCYKTGDSYYGISEIRNILDAQKSYNEMDYSEYKGLKLSSNSGWIKDENSGVDDSTLTNEEGLVVTKVQGTEVNRIPPGQVSPQLSARKANDAQAIQMISGVTDSVQGIKPVGVTAAAAISKLQAQATGRARLKSRYLEEYSLLRLGKLVASRVVNYWSNERSLRLYDNNGQIKYVDFKPENVKDLDYDIKAVPGSTSGLDKQTIYEIMNGLVQQQLISPKTFIELTDLPYKNRILEELEKTNQMAQENQMLKDQIMQLTNPQMGMPIQPGMSPMGVPTQG